MCARNGREILVAQLELHRAGVKLGFPQPSSDHLGKPHQGRFQLSGIGSVVIVGVLMANRFRVDVSPDFAVKPSARVFTASLTRKSQAPFSETLTQF